MSSEDPIPSIPLSERMTSLRALLDRYESEGLQKLETPQYDELAKALNTAWPKAYIVKTWYESAENAGRILIGILIGAFVMVLIVHFFISAPAPCFCPNKCV